MYDLSDASIDCSPSGRLSISIIYGLIYMSPVFEINSPIGDSPFFNVTVLKSDMKM
jgi:hypothetical protein